MIAFNTNTFILTANKRLAQVMRQGYEQRQIDQGSALWETPLILPLRTWLQETWRSHPIESNQLLTSFQEQLVWCELIHESCHEHYPLLHVTNTARLVQEAWKLINQWQISVDSLKEQAHATEVDLFIDWAEQFMQRCSQQSWVSEDELPKRLQKYFLPELERASLAGFDELPPSLQNLLKKNLNPTPAHSSPALHHWIGADLESEIKQMAQWAKNWLEQFPEHRIGCISTQLRAIRPQVLRIFTQTFVPENQLPGIPPSTAPFNISGGQNLDQFEMIHIALQTLAIDTGKMAVETLDSLLQSPYLCQNETDLHLGAQLSAECRRPRQFDVPLKILLNAITQYQSDYPHHTWLQRWRDFAELNHEPEVARLPSEWAKHFSQLLKALGWPGGRSLNSLEYQLIQRWQELCIEFAELDKVCSTISRGFALNCLQRMAAQTIFQPQTEPSVPIQILDVSESCGFDFDALWVMGLDDRHWPRESHPNPFLPPALQAAMYAQDLTPRLLSSAPKIWLSCSPPNAEEAARFSRLIPPASNLVTQAVPLHSALTELIFASGVKETWAETMGPSVSATEKIRGGSGILTKQAECPFQAFATYRLHAKALDEPQLGISPSQRGALVHQALEYSWQRLKNQQNLLALSDAELQNLCAKITDQVFNESKLPADSAFTLIEKQRLTLLINEWLVLEKRRPPFTVLEQESEHAIKIAGLTLQIKIDRIDQLTDGARLLIDYKTSLTSLQGWLDERVRQPQLPLYAVNVLNDSTLTAVAFAQLHRTKLSFKGLHDESWDTLRYFPSGIINVNSHRALSAPQTWQGLLEFWGHALEKLADEFIQGVARVDPMDNPAPCSNCALHTLCRIYSVPEPL